MATSATDPSRPWLAAVRAVLIGVVVAAGPVALAGGRRVDGYAAARADAAAARRPLAVLVHGATWQAESRRIVETVWRTEPLAAAIREPLTITEISVPQSPDEATARAFAAATAGWDPDSVKTFPAVQVYGSDGRLLRTLSGRELREAGRSVAALAAALDEIGGAVRERDRLLEALATPAAGDAASLVDALARLGLRPEDDAVERFRAIDPQDRSGWVARLSFPGWEFVRGVGDRIAKGEAAVALDEVEALLADPRYEPAQRCLLLAGKGMLLAALDRPEEAWQAYGLAQECDPDGPAGKAVLRHARRTVEPALRLDPTAAAGRSGSSGRVNLTRDRAVLTVVPPDPRYDRPADHPSLFSGQLREFAFHSAAVPGPHVVIDLREVCSIDLVEVVNRRSHENRAAGLTAWISTDGTSWRQVWQAEAVAPAWTIDLRTAAGVGPEARYLKLGLPADRSGILHLRAVNAFGTRTKAARPVAKERESRRSSSR